MEEVSHQEACAIEVTSNPVLNERNEENKFGQLESNEDLAKKNEEEEEDEDKNYRQRASKGILE